MVAESAPAVEEFAPQGIIDGFANTASLSAIFAQLSMGKYSTEGMTPENEKQIYDNVVAAQTLLEQLLVEGLKSGKFKKVGVIIHTPRPCNPLSYKEGPGNKRTITLGNLLREDAAVVCVYQESQTFGLDILPKDVGSREEYEKAADNFAKYSAYPNFVWYGVKDQNDKLSKKMSGASYFIETDEGEKFCFLIHSFQVQTVDKAGDRDWHILAGRENNNAIIGRLSYLDNFFYTETETLAAPGIKAAPGMTSRKMIEKASLAKKPGIKPGSKLANTFN